MDFQKPRLMIAALRGGSGKTIVSLGIAAAWRLDSGLRVIPYKKGPDYIDAGWLAVSAGHPCYNLDPFLMRPEEILSSFVRRSTRGDVSLIEGNRGLYDGVDAGGSYSSAELAKLLRAPVILVLDATKVTRTAAALVLGCQHLDPDVNIAGVILNQVAGKRHEKVLRGAIEQCCGVPIVGVVAKGNRNFFPERHLGLVPPQESGDIAGAVSYVAQTMRDSLDLDALRKIAESAPPLGWPVISSQGVVTGDDPVTIGVIRDGAFQFYYPENLEALEERGAVLKEISSLESGPFPSVDALYIGGGFPETHLEVLSGNRSFRKSLKREIEAGLPVYAECGGLMFLCSGIHQQEKTFPMVGVFPFGIAVGPKPQGHGYTVMECVNENPFFARGTAIKGHEFHYSRVVDIDANSHPFVFRMKKGCGIVAGWDGICYKNVLASYTHIHAVGNEQWAVAMVDAARGYRRTREDRAPDSRMEPENIKSGPQEYQTVC